MITDLQDICDTFSSLHDGDISNWSGNKAELNVQIDCLYLAELLDPGFDHFLMTIYQIEKIEFDAWTPPGNENLVLTELPDILQTELEIISAEINSDNTLLIVMVTDDNRFVGGNLTLQCKGIRIYDQHKNELTVEQLKATATKYWEAFGKNL